MNDYVDKVAKMGIRAGYENFYTSSQATAMYIHENYPGQVVYCMGTRSLVKELREAGIQVVTEVDDRASIVLIGFDTEILRRRSGIPVSCLVRTWCIWLRIRTSYVR